MPNFSNSFPGLSVLCAMGLQMAALASGSNGNCYYVGNETDAVLIDAGITCKETEKRMERLGLSFGRIRAIFVSHEHSDHIRGIASLAKKYSLPVYITAPTLKACFFPLGRNKFESFFPFQEVAIGSLHVLPFPKIHDAADPHSFVVRSRGVSVGVITDIGGVCAQVSQQFSACDAVFLESNYDRDMLVKGRYPQYLKNRISGGKGHISNEEALELFNKHRSPRLRYLFLSHLSKENNCPMLVSDLFREHAMGVEVIVTSRYSESKLCFAGAETEAAKPVLHSEIYPSQLALF
jgi:phosphoribosyl 1,2-cyclic phosphodiesterase